MTAKQTTLEQHQFFHEQRRDTGPCCWCKADERVDKLERIIQEHVDAKNDLITTQRKRIAELEDHHREHHRREENLQKEINDAGRKISELNHWIGSKM